MGSLAAVQFLYSWLSIKDVANKFDGKSFSHWNKISLIIISGFHELRDPYLLNTHFTPTLSPN